MSLIISIAIPTYNRAAFLKLTLDSLQNDLRSIDAGTVEIIVSDNNSTDSTPEVVAAAMSRGLPIRSVRNPQNIGSDANIAQVFNLSAAPYVLILGDDDILSPSTLSALIDTLVQRQYGVVCLRPYGYDRDPQSERPQGRYPDQIFDDAGDFLSTINALMTLISACVINKALLPDIDANTFCGGNLVQVHLVILAALRSDRNLYRKTYSVACKRNNSGGYEFSQIFVTELGKIFDRYEQQGLSKASIEKIGTRMILGYYPYYLLRQRRENSGDVATTYANFHARFKRRPLFWIWLAPIITLPRRSSLLWGSVTVLMGRSFGGDFSRGLKFLRSWLAAYRQPDKM